MTITAPVELELQHDDIQVIGDDITVVPAQAAAGSASNVTVTDGREPLVPFLVLGVLNLIAMLLVAVLLAF